MAQVFGHYETYALPPHYAVPLLFPPQPAEFLARLGSLLPAMAATALPEVSLPSSFEEHCPGGLSTLATKTRALLAQYPSHPADASDASCASAAPLAAAPGVARSLPGGKKRRKYGSGGALGDRTLSAFGDEMVGTAAAIAVFGWRSAHPASSPEGSPSNGVVSDGSDSAGGAKTTPPHRLSCALCNRRLVTDNFLTLDVVVPRLGTGAGVEAPRAAGSPEGREGSGRSGKRRRLSGGGTPLKPMDLAVEHRSFCPWAAVHPPSEGERLSYTL